MHPLFDALRRDDIPFVIEGDDALVLATPRAQEHLTRFGRVCGTVDKYGKTWFHVPHAHLES